MIKLSRLLTSDAKQSGPYVVFDGRNALAQDKLISLGFKYVGVGRGMG